MMPRLNSPSVRPRATRSSSAARRVGTGWPAGPAWVGESVVTHEDGRHPVPDRGGAELVPEGLSVVVGVRVDDAGRHEEPVGVDRRGRRATDLANLDDRAVLDGDIGAIAGEAGAVDDDT